MFGGHEESWAWFWSQKLKFEIQVVILKSKMLLAQNALNSKNLNGLCKFLYQVVLKHVGLPHAKENSFGLRPVPYRTRFWCKIANSRFQDDHSLNSFYFVIFNKFPAWIKVS